jgi:hypothetical protein
MLEHMTSVGRVAFLFDPAAVRATLAAYPSLAAELDPEREGVKADCSERCRKSERQLYRVLGNTHYDHLVDLLEALDACLGHGYKQPRLLKTRARSSFAPDLAELRVAEHFAIAGCEITGFDESKGEDSVPDLLATRCGFSAAVEVYCPQAFEHLARFRDDLVSGIKNIDLPWDFVFRLSFDRLRDFDDQHRLTYLFDGVLDDGLSADDRGQRIVEEFLAELAGRLNDPPESFMVSREEPELNLRVALELEHVEQTPDGLPERGGIISGPSTTPPNPEWVFARIAGRVEAKAAKAQALGVEADAAVLVVDLTDSDLPRDLRSETYRELFRKILEPRADAALQGHTAIVFADSAGWHEPFIPWFLNTAEGAPRELFELLDPRSLFVRPEGE